MNLSRASSCFPRGSALFVAEETPELRYPADFELECFDPAVFTLECFDSADFTLKCSKLRPWIAAQGDRPASLQSLLQQRHVARGKFVRAGQTQLCGSAD